MAFCSSCGRELPSDALYCPDCGAPVVGLTIPQHGMSPSYFNASMTATSQPQAAPPGGTPQEERKQPNTTGRRGLMLAIIAVLVVLLVGVTLGTGVVGQSGGGGGGAAINSPSNPLTGEQLYAAYTANRSEAAASYTNKTLYIRDSLDYGVSRNFDGQYYSSVDSGTVVLVWSDQAQVGQLYPGAVVLAKCLVEGLQASRGDRYVLYLQGCDLISVETQTITTSTASASMANL